MQERLRPGQAKPEDGQLLKPDSGEHGNEHINTVESNQDNKKT